MSTLDGKKAIVTGGAQGLGEAICLRLAKEGCDVVIGDINEELATKTAAAIAEATGRKVIAVKVDVSNEEDVEGMFNTAVSEIGGVLMLVSSDVFIGCRGQ